MARDYIEKEAKRQTNKENIPDNNLISFEKGFVNGAEWALSHQWILCTERLPEKLVGNFSKEVLVTDVYGGRFLCTFDHKNQVWIPTSKGNKIYEFHKISYWMSIPKLEGGEE